MSKKCKAYSASRLGLEPPDNRKAFYAGWDAALAEPTCKEGLQVEPVAWMDIDSDGQRLTVRMWSDGNSDEVPLYTSPPQRPAEPVQEPYAWMAVGGSIWRHKTSEDDVPLYTALPQMKPLTEEEIYAAIKGVDSLRAVEVARAVERAHGIGVKE